MLSLGVDGTDAPRFYRALDELGVPNTVVRCGHDLSPRLARDVVRAVRANRPDLLHTHLVHGDVYGSIASSVTRIPFVSSRHNDDRYLLGPFRYVDRAFARRASRLIAISDAVRDFLVEAGLPARKLITVRYGLDELPPAASDPTPAEAGVPADAPLVLAVGRLIAQKDHETLIRAFARVRAEHGRRGAGDPRRRPARGGAARPRCRTRPRRRARSAGTQRDPRLARARGRLRAHARAGRASGSCCSRRCWPGSRSSRPGSAPCRRSSSTARRGSWSSPATTAPWRTRSRLLLREPGRARRRSAARGLARARGEFSVARMAERTVDVYREAAG